jgi:hypothetical protein
VAALSPLARVLRQRDEPVALDGVRIGQQVGIGRAGALDDADSAQKIDPAARSVMPFNVPISK